MISIISIIIRIIIATSAWNCVHNQQQHGGQGLQAFISFQDHLKDLKLPYETPFGPKIAFASAPTCKGSASYQHLISRKTNSSSSKRISTEESTWRRGVCKGNSIGWPGKSGSSTLDWVTTTVESDTKSKVSILVFKILLAAVSKVAASVALVISTKATNMVVNVPKGLVIRKQLSNVLK